MPSVWDDLNPAQIYSIGGQRVSFSKLIRRMLQGVDAQGKHVKAIEKGRIAPKGQANGLVPSELEGYALKTKIWGAGGDLRIHGRYRPDNVLFFDRATRH